jgi:hypothetical protein
VIEQRKDVDVNNQRLARFEGRLFAEDGRLHLVIHTDEEAGVAQVSCRIDGESRVLEMSLAEVGLRISSGLTLDNLNGKESSKRILKKDDGWFFAAREGHKGPFVSKAEAEAELKAYILSAQSVSAVG